jgi:hypothetical protein
VAQKLNEVAQDKFAVLLARLFQKLHLKVPLTHSLTHSLLTIPHQVTVRDISLRRD